MLKIRTNNGCYCDVDSKWDAKKHGNGATCGMYSSKYNWCYTQEECGKKDGQGYDKCTPQ